MTRIHFDSNADEATRREQIYAGDIFVYSATRNSLALCELADRLSRDAFHPYEPRFAQHNLSVLQYIEVLKELKPGFIHHPQCKQLVPALLKDLGCDLEQTYFDVPRLRTACAGDYLATGLAYAFKPHRDTWYSPPMSQINWWMPVYPICHDNTMAFHPQYWGKAVANNSAMFDYQAWNRGGRAEAANQSLTKDTRFQSAAIEDLCLDDDLRLVCPPGGIIVFSAAHLHSTVPNCSTWTRFSIDFRTVDRRDVLAGRGAPNMDSEATGSTLMDYMRCGDLAHFHEQEIARDLQTPKKPICRTSAELVERSVKC